MSLIIQILKIYDSHQIYYELKERKIIKFYFEHFKEKFTNRFKFDVILKEDLQGASSFTHSSSEFKLENKLFYKFKNELPVNAKDKLEVECFYKGSNKSMGKFVMLMHPILNNQNKNNPIEIEDFLTQPTTLLELENSNLFKIKINFKIYYEPTSNFFLSDVFIIKPVEPNNLKELVKKFKTGKRIPYSRPNIYEEPLEPFEFDSKTNIMNSIQYLLDTVEKINTDSTKASIAIFEKLNRENEMLRIINEPQNWKIRLRVIEIKDFTASNQYAYFVVQIGSSETRTKPRPVDKFKFDKDNEQVFYELIQNKKLKDLLNFKISVFVYLKQFMNERLLCKFSTDFITVYNHPGHKVFGKWSDLVYLRSNDDTNELDSFMGFNCTDCGQIKFDIEIESKTDITTHKYDAIDIDSEEEVDEYSDKKQFKPYGLIGNLHQVRIKFKITNLSILNEKLNERARQNPNQTNIQLEPNMYKIKITINDQSKLSNVILASQLETEVIKLEFITFYPPLVSFIKIELFSLESTQNLTEIGCEYLSIHDISDYMNDICFPSYGPRYIDLYKKSCSLDKKQKLSSFVKDLMEITTESQTNYLNDYESEENNLYAARLCLSIESDQSISNNKENTKKDSIYEYNQIERREFILFLILDQVYMIDERFKKDLLSFQIAIGNHGYDEEKYLNMHITDQTQPLQLASHMPIYLPYEKYKKCLSLKFTLEDTREHMFKYNFIKNCINKINESLGTTQETKINHKIIDQVFETLKTTVDEFNKIINLFEEIKFYLDRFEQNFLTNFDKYRIYHIKIHLKRINNFLRRILDTIQQSDENFSRLKNNERFKLETISLIKLTLNDIQKLNQDPFKYFPHVNLMLLANKKLVGQCTIKAHDLIWSHNSLQTGSNCGKIVYIYMQSLGFNEFGEKEALARLRIFPWLGLSNEKNVIFEHSYLKNGFQFSGLNEIELPNQIFYEKKRYFQLNAYLYQGRGLLLLDIAGESDPYAKISFINRSVVSKTITRTVMNPNWSEVLTIKDICLYGENILENLPEIVVEIFDEDPLTSEFMGKFNTVPAVFSKDEEFDSSKRKLKWFKLNYYDSRNAGDILAYFELVEIEKEDNQVVKINNRELSILPIEMKKKQYILEIIYWGLRNLGTTSFTNIGFKNFSLEIEIGDQKLEPYLIEKYSNNENFTVQKPRKTKIDLFEEDIYKPHLNIKCECNTLMPFYSSPRVDLDLIKKIYKQKFLVGSYTVNSISNYIHDNKKLKRYLAKNGQLDIKPNVNFLNFIELMSYEQNEKKLKIDMLNESQKKKFIDLENLDWWSKYNASNEIEDDPSENENDSNENSIKKLFKKNSEESYNQIRKKNSIPKDEIQKITIYEQELEKEFDFSENLETFNLIVGKNISLENNNFRAQFKGKFMLYDEDSFESDSDLKNYFNENNGFLRKNPPIIPYRVKVNVYIIKVNISNPIFMKNNNNPDWRITFECGNQKLSDIKIKNNSNEFLLGSSFQFDAKFPSDSQLTISVTNKQILNANELIGETRIDLEDRFYASCNAHCGLPRKYELKGYNAWRDVLTPEQILKKYCKNFNFKAPLFIRENDMIKLQIRNKNSVLLIEKQAKDVDYPNGISSFQETDQLVSNEDKYDTNHIKEQMALDVLNSWETLTSVKLVPEHIEKRYLYNKEMNDIEQGNIEMWIDMFPFDSNQETTPINLVDIRLRKPKRYQLRVIVYSTSEVELDDYNPVTGEMSSDIYIKGYLIDQKEHAQKTDIHMRSLNGDGSFNWRFIFDFDYLPSEKSIIYTRKGTLGFGDLECKTKPILVLDCYDSDEFSADDCLGSIEIDLSQIPIGARTASECKPSLLSKRSKYCNLFRRDKHQTGWYPMLDLNKKLGGKVNIKLDLLTEQEANDQPAGLGRNPPLALPEPKREATSFSWYTSPFKAFRFMIWKHHSKKVLIGIAIIIGFLFLIILLYRLSLYVVDKIG